MVLAISAGVLAQVYNFFPPPNSTITSHGLLVGSTSNAINSVSVMAADTVLQGQGASADPAAVSVNNCGDSTHALSYSTSTHAFGCQAISGGAGTTLNQVTKASTTSRNSTVTPTLDPELQFSVGSGIHTMTCLLQWQTFTGIQGARIQLSFSGTSSGFPAMTVFKYDSNGTPSPQSFQVFNLGASIVDTSFPNANDNAVWMVSATMQATSSGTLGIAWAQGNNTGNNLALNQGSWCWET